MTRWPLAVLLISIAACGGSNSATHACGDGIVNGTEECDDGNTVSGDGCSSVCKKEVGMCGDGIVDVATETCDDGNRVSGDGCSATCQTEAVNKCGDGVIDNGEACDDHNTAAGDGCSASCQVEAGYTCTGTPSVCTMMGTQASGTCAQPIVVTMTNGTGSASGDTTSTANEVTGDCDGYVEDSDGNDQVFTFTLAQASDVDIELTADWDANLRLMKTACDTTTQVSDHVFHDGCADVGLDGDGESLTAQSLPAGTYYVVVDSYDPDPMDLEMGPFTFTVTATAPTAVCGNGIYDDNEQCDDTTNPSRCSATCTLVHDLAETEPNDDVAHAMALTQTHHQIFGSFSSDTDVDFYTFTLTAPATIELETYDAIDPNATYTGAGSVTTLDCTATETNIVVFDSTGDTTDDSTMLYSDYLDGSSTPAGAFSSAQCSYIGPADRDGPDPTQGVNLPAGTYTIKLEGIASKAYILDTKFTPDLGSTLPVAPVAGDLVLNEFMAADSTADTNCDGATTSTNDEFIELVNVATHPIDLTGVTISDSVTVRHTFAAAATGSMTLDPGKAVVVWAGGAPACPGVDDWFVASSGQLGLNDAGDTITLKDASANQLLTYTFGTATATKSFNLNPDITGTTYALHDAITGAVGAFSPGKKSDGSAF